MCKQFFIEQEDSSEERDSGDIEYEARKKNKEGGEGRVDWDTVGCDGGEG